MTILIIEDDFAIRTGLEYYLKQENFNVLVSSTGKEGIIECKKDISLVLLDINLPDIDGFKVFEEIQKIKKVPVIFLTANDLEISIVKGLDMGAEDYITKPFKARELLSRIKNVLRRNNTINNSIKIHNVEIDLKQAKVLKNNRDVFLTALEYKILLALVSSPNVVFTREKILADIWDVNEEFVNDNTLTVYIKRIRKKIEDDPANPKIIQTIRGIGYKIGVVDE